VIRELGTLAEAMRPELLGWALTSMRVLPVVLLCPVLGGQLVPVPVRMVMAGCLGVALRPLTWSIPSALLEAVAWCGHEAAVGLLIGLSAALPFDAARIGGRLVDLVRGTSAEAALPVAGHRESASADLLFQLVLAMALAGGAAPRMIRVLGRSMVLLPPGLSPVGGDAGLAMARTVGVALATGLAVAAPVIVLSWATDAAVGLALRAAPGIALGELGVPVRILGGATVLWLSLGLVADRLLEGVLVPEAGFLHTVLGP